MTQALVPNPLPSWNESPTKLAIIDFVQRVSNVTSPDFVPPQERIAVFDNDGTLWCERPMPVQADFLLRRVGEMVEAEPSLSERQPWKAVAEQDFRWLNHAITKHYDGDDSDLQQMAEGLLAAYSGRSIDEFESAASEFLATATHPTNGRPYIQCTYQPMVELLQLLETNGFSNYIATGGGRDFLRTVAEQVYRIPPERVIGSSVALSYNQDRHTIVHEGGLDFFDDGPEKAVRIWSRLGRRPILACGNSNGDIEMLDFTAASNPSLGLLIFHDDAVNEFSYRAGAERAVDHASHAGWPIVSMKNDWRCVFSDVA